MENLVLKENNRIRKIKDNLLNKLKAEYLGKCCIIVDARLAISVLFKQSFPNGIFGKIIDIDTDGRILIRKNKNAMSRYKYGKSDRHIKSHIKHIKLV